MTSLPKTILIVDDNLEDRHTYHRYLKQAPIPTYNIIEAEMGEEGIELFFRHQPDLILLDFNLPDLDGLEFVAKLKENCAQLGGFIQNRLPPIIVLTGEGNEAIAVKVMKAGVRDYLTKGNTNANSLCFAVRSVLEQVCLHQLALQQSEARFRVLVTQAPVGIFQTNCQGDYVYVNPCWMEITGLSSAEAMGQGWGHALHPEDKARFSQQCYEAAQLGTEFTSEYRFQSPDGRITWVSGKAVTMYSDRGEHIGYFGTIIDISERKRAEALSKQQQERLISINQDLEQTTSLLKKRNRELDEFTYIVSHDLKAPLRAIYNLSEWIEEDLEDKLNDDTSQNFKLLRSRVVRMQMFIQSLLEYSRVGREQTQKEIVAVKDLLVDIIDSLAPPPKFAIAIGESMPTLNTQKIALEQVFTNLISNAIKHHYSQAGKIEISVTETPEFYYFAVTDDGVGIALEHQELIFGVFQTLSSRDHNESSGIGLSIVKKIVESQGGTIELESQVGKGSTFSFSWRK